MALSPAQRHRLKKSAAALAAADEFGGVRPDVNVYQLQLHELKNDLSLLKNIQSHIERANHKTQLIPKYTPYIDGIIDADRSVDDEIITTVMLWCFDANQFEYGLKIANFALKHGLKMPDNFQRSVATIVVEEISNVANSKLKANEDFELQYLIQADELTSSFDMHDQVRAKLHLALGRIYLANSDAELSVKHLNQAIKYHENCGGKTDLQKAERLLKQQVADKAT